MVKNTSNCEQDDCIIKTLDDIAIKFKTDKSSAGHGYTLIYENIFSSIRYSNIRLLEIGVQRQRSMRMWNEYFTNAIIVGIDIDKKCVSRYYDKYANNELVFLEYADQTNIFDLKIITEKYGNFDVIIDDGSHKTNDHITSFEYLYHKSLNGGGMYIIEDIQTIDLAFRNGKFINSKINIIDYLTSNMINHQIINTNTNSSCLVCIPKQEE